MGSGKNLELNITMDIDFDSLTPLLLLSAVSLGGVFLLYKKYITSIFDPLFNYVYITAFSSILIIYVLEQKYILSYFVCHLFFFIGFVLAQRLKFSRGNDIMVPKLVGRLEFQYTVFFLLLLYILSNLFVLYSRGSAIFSDDPYARETNYEEGFGIFRRINWGVGGFLYAAVTILYLTKKKRIYFNILILLTILTALEGTKSSLLRIIIVVASLLYHPVFVNEKSIVNKLKRMAPIGGVMVLGVALFILTKESEDGVLVSLIRRLIYSADVVMYFYQPQNEYLLSVYSPLDFIKYSFNPITSFFKLSTYVEPFGSLMVSNMRSGTLKTDVYLAPNTPFYIEGQLFFGYYGVFIYSLCIGFMFSLIRKLFFSIVQSSYFVLALACTFFLHSVNLVIETNFFITTCFNTCLFVLPAYIGISFFLQSSLKIRKIKFQ